MLFLCVLAAALFGQAGSALDGTWQFVMDTEGGERTAEARFKVEGTAVSGKWANVDVKGTFTDGKLDLAFPMHSEEGGISATLKITGELKNSELVGQWSFAEHSGTYKAKKKG